MRAKRAPWKQQLWANRGERVAKGTLKSQLGSSIWAIPASSDISHDNTTQANEDDALMQLFAPSILKELLALVLGLLQD